MLCVVNNVVVPLMVLGHAAGSSNFWNFRLIGPRNKLLRNINRSQLVEITWSLIKRGTERNGTEWKK